MAEEVKKCECGMPLDKPENVCECDKDKCIHCCKCKKKEKEKE